MGLRLRRMVKLHMCEYGMGLENKKKSCLLTRQLRFRCFGWQCNRTEYNVSYIYTASLFFCLNFNHLWVRHAFDVDQKTQTFLNRRVLAYVDAGIPDGIEVDTNGNVYTACADGVQVRIDIEDRSQF